jgi:hypothetical protein
VRGGLLGLMSEHILKHGDHRDDFSDEFATLVQRVCVDPSCRRELRARPGVLQELQHFVVENTGRNVAIPTVCAALLEGAGAALLVLLLAVCDQDNTPLMALSLQIRRFWRSGGSWV